MSIEKEFFQKAAGKKVEPPPQVASADVPKPEPSPTPTPKLVTPATSKFSGGKNLGCAEVAVFLLQWFMALSIVASLFMAYFHAFEMQIIPILLCALSILIYFALSGLRVLLKEYNRTT